MANNFGMEQDNCQSTKCVENCRHVARWYYNVYFLPKKRL